MAFTEASNDGTLNGTTPVTIVAAPAASTRRLVRTITIYNADTVSATVTVSFVSGANTRIILKTTLASGATLILGNTSGEIFILNATNKSMTAVLSAAITTTQPDFTSHYADVT